MAKSLVDFISYVKSDGFALSSQFAIEFSFPFDWDMPSRVTNEFENILMLCEQTFIPGLSFLTSPVRTTGEVREVPYEKSFDPIQFIFLLDRNLKQKLLFDRWMDRIQGMGTRIFQYPEEYVRDITVYSYDRNNGIRHKTILRDAFPKTIGQVSLSYDNKDVARLPVVLSYKYFETFYYTGVESSKIRGNNYYDADSSLAVSLVNWISEFVKDE